jgi:hypothetical protein
MKTTPKTPAIAGIVRTILSVVFLFAVNAGNTQVAIYFAAHQDDWQLFMGNNAYGDIVAAQNDPNNRVVIVHLTAGDGGHLMTVDNYVLDREKCAMNSVVLAASAGQTYPSQIIYSTPIIYGHPIRKATYRNIEVYFLRLPDGGCNPNYGCSGMGSMLALKTAFTNNLPAMDNSTTYTSWFDLTQTLYWLVAPYAQHNSLFYPGSKLWVNGPEKDSNINPNDHMDHYITGELAEIASMPFCPFSVEYIDYHSANLSPNLSNDGIENEAGMFGACSAVLAMDNFYDTWDAGHKDWLSRNYYNIYEFDCGAYQSAPGGNSSPEPVTRRAVSPRLDADHSMPTETFAHNSEIMVYPNPATNDISISMPEKAGMVLKVEILDVTARKVLKTVFVSERIDVGDLNNGLYFARMYTSNGETRVQKFYKSSL